MFIHLYSSLITLNSTLELIVQSWILRRDLESMTVELKWQHRLRRASKGKNSVVVNGEKASVE